MKYEKYVERLQRFDKVYEPDENGLKYSEIMAKNVDIWDNDACRGYVIKAAEVSGFTPEQIRDLMEGLRWAFNEYSVDNAERAYNESQYY